jgi:hypothetical protein
VRVTILPRTCALNHWAQRSGSNFERDPNTLINRRVADVRDGIRIVCHDIDGCLSVGYGEGGRDFSEKNVRYLAAAQVLHPGRRIDYHNERPGGHRLEQRQRHEPW